MITIVKDAFDKSKQTYGSPRLAVELRDKGYEISRATVARIMNNQGYKARKRSKYVVTTENDVTQSKSPNILNRQFEATRLNEKWVSDITYIPSKKGWLYLTVIIDLADRMVVAWNLSKDLHTENTVLKAMNEALIKRSVKKELIFHSDQGVQYCSTAFRKLILENELITQSMSRKGNCWDNAVAESFFKTIKVEWTNRFEYKSFDEAKSSIFEYIETWYNTRRRHSAIGYISPWQKHKLFFNQTAA